MNMHDDWTLLEGSYTDLFYTTDETIANVKENFDLRRYHSSEGYDIKINGVFERCLVQTSSNPLRELNDFRKIHCPISADVKRGYYVEFENSVWIIDTNVVNVDGAYLSTRMSRCQYILRWQNNNGEIVERWAYVSDQTKYSSGEKGNTFITIGDNQYGLLVPIDAETKLLKRDMRFPFDFDDAQEPDIYELTNRKVILSEGVIQLSFAFASFDRDKDKHVTLDDGSKVWICDYHSPAPSTPPEPDETTDLSAIILGGNMLRCGRAKTWTVTFKDQTGNEVVDCDFRWNVVSDFAVTQHVNEKKIQLKVDDENCIDSYFLLSIIFGGTVIDEIRITIVEGL